MTDPFENFCLPTMQRIRVVFPDPDGPINPIILPLGKSRFISEITVLLPKETVSLLIFTDGVVIDGSLAYGKNYQLL
jgi:hypothetical protein